MSAIKAHAPIEAPADIMALARENCAIRARAKGQHELAASYEAGSADAGWAMRHEVNKILAERAARERMDALAEQRAPLAHVPV